MSTGVVILLIIIVLAIVALAMFLSARAKRRRSEALQGRFGSEYDRAVGEHGDRRAAETHLSEVADRRDSLEIRDLSPQERSGYTNRWQRVQADFVDSPGAAVGDADSLIDEVMRERGYPVDDFDTRAELVSADHPEVVEHYRAAHAARDGDPTTEEQRRAFVHYRALFAELVGTSNGRADHPTADEETSDQATPPQADRPTDASAVEDSDVADDVDVRRGDDVRHDQPATVDGTRDERSIDLNAHDHSRASSRDEPPAR
jgi:hypothetical protein